MVNSQSLCYNRKPQEVEVLYLKEHSIDIQLSHQMISSIYLDQANVTCAWWSKSWMCWSMHEQKLSRSSVKKRIVKNRQVIGLLSWWIVAWLSGRRMSLNIQMVRNDELDKFVALYEEEIIKDSTTEAHSGQALGQIYVDSIKHHDVTFGIGPQRGLVKTFLAVTNSVTALKRGQIKRIILTCIQL